MMFGLFIFIEFFLFFMGGILLLYWIGTVVDRQREGEKEGDDMQEMARDRIEPGESRGALMSMMFE